MKDPLKTLIQWFLYLRMIALNVANVNTKTLEIAKLYIDDFGSLY